MTTLLKISNNTYEIKSINAISCSLKRKNLSADELAIEVLENSPIAQSVYDSKIELWQNNRRTFAGRISKILNSNMHDKQSVKIIAKNAFNELSQIIFQQPINYNGVIDTTQRYRSKVILGATSNGTKKSIENTAKEILTYAISKGADFQIGKIDIDNDLLFDECIDITCADALCKILRWAPGCAVFFDYSVNGSPAINIQKRSSLKDVEIDTTAGNVKQYSANRRDDLVINAVEIKYERTNKIDNNTYLDYLEDVYPEELTDARKTIVMNVELAGSKTTSQTNVITTEPIRTDLKSWWKKHVSLLADLDDFEIIQTSRNGNLPNELTEGSITEKMNCSVETDSITGEFSYRDENDSEVRKTISIKMVTTSASTGTYNWHSLKEYAEQPLTNLAKTIYQATSMLQFEGNIEILNTNADLYFGKNISINSKTKNIVDKMPAYFVEENLFTKTINIKFGPPKHLYPDDISELFRINRSRTISTLSVDFDTGIIRPSTIVVGGKTASTQNQDISTNYSRFVISSDMGKIDINSNDVPNGDTAKLNEVLVCYNGALCSAKIISTTPELV